MQTQVKFYRIQQLKQQLGVSSASIWLWVKKGKFPRPVKLSSNTTAWSAQEVDQWAADRIAESKGV